MYISYIYIKIDRIYDKFIQNIFMKIVIKSNLSLTSTNDYIQDKTILSAITFDKNKQRIQTIFYKNITKIDINKVISISKDYPYIGFIIVKYNKIDRKYYQYPLVIIDTSEDTEFTKYVYLPDDLIKKVPFGNFWKKSLIYDDFTNSPIYVENEPIYLNAEDLSLILTDDGQKIIIGFI